jgi:hypothetical protein
MQHVAQIQQFGHMKCQSLRSGFLFVFSHGMTTAMDKDQGIEVILRQLAAQDGDDE